MTISQRTNIRLGAAFAVCTLITAASANSPERVQITAAAEMSEPPPKIVAIIGPEHDGTLGTIFFGAGVADGSGQHFGGPR